MAFSVSAKLGPITLKLAFFEDDNCGVLADGTINTTSELAFFVPPDMSDPFTVQCDIDCIDAPEVGNSTNYARSAKLLPDNTVWNENYGCHVWSKTDANGGTNQDCATGSYSDSHLIEAGDHCASQLDIRNGAIIQCQGIPGLYGGNEDCSSVKE